MVFVQQAVELLLVSDDSFLTDEVFGEQMEVRLVDSCLQFGQVSCRRLYVLHFIDCRLRKGFEVFLQVLALTDGLLEPFAKVDLFEALKRVLWWVFDIAFEAGAEGRNSLLASTLAVREKLLIAAY